MKNKSPKLAAACAAFLMIVNIFCLAGCGKTEDTGSQIENEVQIESSETTTEAISVDTDAEVQPPMDTAQTLDDVNHAGIDSIMIAYSGAEYTPKTQEEWDEIERKERAAFEEKVKAADGISEEEAVEIAQKALEADLGADAKKLVLTIDDTFGWKSDLCIADWSEIKEKDRGALAYSINFNNGEKVSDFKDLINYNCTVNAVDGSILEAYSSLGLSDNAVYYEH